MAGSKQFGNIDIDISGNFTVDNPLGWLKSHLECHFGIFRDKGVRYIRKIMCYLEGDRNDEIVISTANHLAEVNKADIVFVKIIPNDQKEKLEEVENQTIELTKTCHNYHSVTIKLSDSPVKLLSEASVDYDLFIFGSTSYNFWTNIFGNKDDTLMAQSACSVLAVQAAPRKAQESL